MLKSDVIYSYQEKKKMAPDSKQQCLKCNKNINLRTQKFLSCDGECKKLCHFENCTNVSKESYAEIINKDSLWFCENCKNKRVQRRSNINGGTSNTHITPNTTTTQQQNITLHTIRNDILDLIKIIFLNW